MKFILFIIVYTTSASDMGPMMAHKLFDSQEQCEAAAKKAEQDVTIPEGVQVAHKCISVDRLLEVSQS